MDEIALRRFDKAAGPEGCNPTDVIEAARKWLTDEATNAPDHIMVLVGRTTEDGSSGTKFFQAGKYPFHAQLGLCLEAALMIRESG